MNTVQTSILANKSFNTNTNLSSQENTLEEALETRVLFTSTVTLKDCLNQRLYQQVS